MNEGRLPPYLSRVPKMEGRNPGWRSDALPNSMRPPRRHRLGPPVQGDQASPHYSSVRLRVFSFPRFVLLSNRRCFEPFVGFVALRFLRGIATL